jgi:hypothetical protein
MLAGALVVDLIARHVLTLGDFTVRTMEACAALGGFHL